jgi:hypothetical protein
VCASVSADYDFLAAAATSARASVLEQPLPGLDIAAANGWAKVLKRSTVVTSNGSEATFSSGGDQNFLGHDRAPRSLSQTQFSRNSSLLPA